MHKTLHTEQHVYHCKCLFHSVASVIIGSSYVSSDMKMTCVKYHDIDRLEDVIFKNKGQHSILALAAQVYSS